MPVKEVVLCHITVLEFSSGACQYFSTIGSGSAAVLQYLMPQQRTGFSMSGMNL